MKWILLFSVFLLAASRPVTAQVAVITHHSVSTAELSAQQLADIYTLEETKWDDKTRIVIFDWKDKNNASKRAFYAFLGMRYADVKRMWLRTILAGEGQSPTLLNSTQEMLEHVRATPGAIGYVPLRLVPNDVRVVAVIE